MLQCPECRRIILDSTSEGGWKLRTRMIVFNEDGAHAICPSCKHSVQVPIKLDGELNPLPKPKLFLGNDK